jgi:adenosine kinase
MDFQGKFQDHILPEKIHILNVSFMVNSLTEKYGGTAGNIAYTLALLGEKPTILAAVGKDFDNYAQRLTGFNLPLCGLRRIEEEFTSGCYITTDAANTQITGFNPGAMKYGSEDAFNGIPPEECLAVVAPGNLDDMTGYPRKYRECGIKYIYDPGQQIPVLTGEQIREAIEGCHILISNDYELEMIFQATGLTKDRILKMDKTIITTLGKKGSHISTSEGETTIPAAPEKVQNDPTGAGDAYRAGLIKGLVEGRDLETAAKMGTVCGSFSVECHGTQEHHFTMEEFWERYNQAF